MDCTWELNCGKDFINYLRNKHTSIVVEKLSSTVFNVSAADDLEEWLLDECEKQNVPVKLV